MLDTEPDPTNPRVVKVIEPEELVSATGYSRPHTVHCGPDGIYVNATRQRDWRWPGGVFVLDHDTFEPNGPWEIERGPQCLATTSGGTWAWDTMVTSEWGTPAQVEHGVQPEMLMAKEYGRLLHFWDLRARQHVQSILLGDDNQWCSSSGRRTIRRSATASSTWC